MQIHHIVPAVVRDGAQRIRDRTARKGKSDQRNRRPDDDGGHDLVDPANARKLDGNCDDDIYKSRKYRTDQKAEIAHRHGSRSRKCRSHRTDKCKRASEEHGALEFGEEQIDERSRPRAEQCRRDRHIAPRQTVDLHRDGNGRRKDRKQLLQCKQDQLPGLWSVFHAVNEFHWYTSP